MLQAMRGMRSNQGTVLAGYPLVRFSHQDDLRSYDRADVAKVIEEQVSMADEFISSHKIDVREEERVRLNIYENKESFEGSARVTDPDMKLTVPERLQGGSD